MSLSTSLITSCGFPEIRVFSLKLTFRLVGKEKFPMMLFSNNSSSEYLVFV